MDKFVNLGVGDRSVVSKGPFESIKEVFLACVHTVYFILTVKVAKTDEDSDMSDVSRDVVGYNCSYTLSFCLF